MAMPSIVLLKHCVSRPKQFDLTPKQNLPTQWNNIKINGLTYTYDNQGNHGVKDINLTVKSG